MAKPLLYYLRASRVRNFSETARTIAADGIQCMTLAPTLGEFELVYQDDARRLEQVMRDVNLQTPGMHGAFGGQYDMNTSPGIARRAIPMHQDLMIHASQLGVKTYVVHPGARSSIHSQSHLWDNVRRTLDALVPVAEKCNVTIALENLPPQYIGSDVDSLVRFVKEYDSPYVRLCFDSGHANMCADPVAILKHMAPYTVTMHLHDNFKDSDAHLSPGEGNIDWSALSAVIRTCTNALHVEIESFNSENRPHRELHALYASILDG